MSKPTPLVLLLMAAGITSASAMSLGPSPDSASVGRPLDVRFPVQADAQEIGGSLCLSVDVRYGDDRISDSTAILEGVEGGSRFVRVRASSPVNEPIVSIRLQAGCDQPLTRNYTLLAGAPVQTALSAGIPSIGSAAPGGSSRLRDPSVSSPAAARAPRASAAPDTSRTAAPVRSPASPYAATAPTRPKTSASVPRADTGTGAGPRSIQGAVSPGTATRRPSAQPILQLDDPAYFRPSPDAAKSGAAATTAPAAGGAAVVPPETARLGAAVPDASPVPAAPAAPVAVPDDQIALMRAELAAARKEIARLQTEVTARNSVPAPEETDHRTYLIAVLAALLAAAAAAWALRRKKQRKTEAGAWWHGSHSMQAPDPSQAAFAASAASQFDLGNGSAHDLAYPVSMLPEDLDRASMFPDFLREDARPTMPPDTDAGITLPGETADRSALWQAEAPQASTAIPNQTARYPAAPTIAASAMPAAPAPAAPVAPIVAPQAPAAAYPVPIVPASHQPSLSRYNELDLDLDVDQPDIAERSAPLHAPATPAPLDDGNLIDFESSSLGGFVKPSARERQD